MSRLTNTTAIIATLIAMASATNAHAGNVQQIGVHTTPAPVVAATRFVRMPPVGQLVGGVVTPVLPIVIAPRPYVPNYVVPLFGTYSHVDGLVGGTRWGPVLPTAVVPKPYLGQPLRIPAVFCLGPCVLF